MVYKQIIVAVYTKMIFIIVSMSEQKIHAKEIYQVFSHNKTVGLVISSFPFVLLFYSYFYFHPHCYVNPIFILLSFYCYLL